MHITGRCHCGEITFEAEHDPEKVGICHCTDCQALSASDYHVVVMVAGDIFRFTQGKPRYYVKTADSGNRRRLAFCGTCASAFYSSEDRDAPPIYNIRAGTIDQRRELVPVFECWRSSALPWVAPGEGRTLFDKNPG